MVLNKLDTHMQKRAFLTLTPYTHTKINSKCKNTKLKFIEENIGENL